VTTTTIVVFIAFLAFGACFGLATFSRRHLFSEGPSRQAQSGDDTLAQRVIWVLVCSGLWPLMLLTGVVSLCVCAACVCRRGATPIADHATSGNVTAMKQPNASALAVAATAGWPVCRFVQRLKRP
jgi:hypothetical protein